MKVDHFGGELGKAQSKSVKTIDFISGRVDSTACKSTEYKTQNKNV